MSVMTKSPRNGFARRSGAARRHPASLLLVAAVVTAISLLAPLTPAAADPVSSSLQVATGNMNQRYGIELYAYVSAATAPTGVIVVSEGGTELARDTLGSVPQAYFDLPAPTAGPRTLDITYLGSDLVLGSSTTTTVTVGTSAVGVPVTGTVTAGTSTGAVSPVSQLANYSSPIYDTATGAITANGEFGPSTVTTDVPSYGPVSVVFRPFWYQLTGGIADDGTTTLGSVGVVLTVTLVTVGGTTWSAGQSCSVQTNVAFTGAIEPGGLALHGTSTTPVSTADDLRCHGLGAQISSVLTGPVLFDLHVSGPFPTPPISNTATTTTVEVLGPVAVGEQATVRATVTAAGGYVPQGQFEMLSGGTRFTVGFLNGGVATATLDLDVAGPLTITVNYLGYASAFLPSTGSTEVDVDGPPTGLPATGQMTVGTNPTAVFPDGMRLTGADFDPMTGDIGSSSFWFPAGYLTVDTGIIGTTQVKYRMHQTTPMTGHVAADGTVTFDPTGLTLEARSYGSSSTSQNPLADCTYGPIPITLSGTADAGGLHLHAAPTSVPPLPSSSCNGLAGFVNPRIAVSTDVSFDVEGDFRRYEPSTPVDVVTWFPQVAQYNQSYFTASVGSGTDIPTGDVTFRDGATVLGTAPLDATGHASLVASMDEPGTRTITAAYDGDDLHGPGSDTTVVEVTPAPTGLAMDGTVTMGDGTFAIAAGSQLVPASGTSGAALRGDLASSRASLWFAPTTVALDLPGYGPAQVEVRLFQYGQLSAATVGSDGSINGLSGSFVLQVRKVTTSAGTTIPIGCVNLVLLGFDGRLTYTDVGLTTNAGGAGRIPLGACQGPGRAAVERLATGPVAASVHAPL